jgi:hypothetical protein
MASNGISEFPGFDRLFAWRPDSRLPAYMFTSPPIHLDPDQTADFAREMINHNEFEVERGSRVYDCMYDTLGSFTVVSDRLLSTITGARLAGWESFPIRAMDRRGRAVEHVHALYVSSLSGKLDSDKTRVVVRPPPVPDGRMSYVEVGAYFDPQTWDGSDFFRPRGTSLTCCTERAKQVLEEAKLTRILFNPLTEQFMNLHMEYPANRPR